MQVQRAVLARASLREEQDLGLANGGWDVKRISPYRVTKDIFICSYTHIVES